MNKIFKVIWSQHLRRYVVCSELGKSRGKSKKALTIAVIAALSFSPALATDETTYNFIGNSSDLNFFDTNNWDPTVPEGTDSHWDFENESYEDGDITKNGVKFVIDRADLDKDNAVYINFNEDEDGEIKVESLSYANIHIKNGKLNILNTNTDIWDVFNNINIINEDQLLIETSLDASEEIILDSLTVGSRNSDHYALTEIRRERNKPLDPDEDYYSEGVLVGNLQLGNDGTYGKILIDRGHLSINSYDESSNYEKTNSVIGGDGGVGNISILNGGKMVFNIGNDVNESYELVLPDTNEIQYNTIIESIIPNPDADRYISPIIVGLNGGQGSIDITGDESILTSGLGLKVGSGTEGEGKIVVRDSAKLQAIYEAQAFTIYTDEYESPEQIMGIEQLEEYELSPNEINRIISSTAIILGENNGEGHLIVKDSGIIEIGGSTGYSGEVDSVMGEDFLMPDYIGELVVGSSGTGTITLKNEGKIKIGYLLSEEDEYNYQFFSGGQNPYYDPEYEIDEDNQPFNGPIFYGKTVLAAAENAKGIVNFLGKTYQDKQVKASELLFTSDISVGLGDGEINLDHNAGSDKPFIFDIQVTEAYDKIYHSEFLKGSGIEKLTPGKISFNQRGGVTLLEEHECRAFDCEAAPTTTYDYSGDTNILGGELRVAKENLLSQKSHFNIDENGTLNLSNSNQTIKSLNNKGVILLGKGPVNVTARTQEPHNNVLTVKGDYSGNGTLFVNSIWNKPLDPNASYADETNSSTDRLHIEGSVLENTHTEIKAYGNKIGGDIELPKAGMIYSLPVVTVEGNAAPTSFYGTAETGQTGYMAKIGHGIGEGGINHYYWTLGIAMTPLGPTTMIPLEPSTPEEMIPLEPSTPTVEVPVNVAPLGPYIPILHENVALITQMAAANIDQLTLEIGRYSQRNAMSLEGPLWARTYGQHGKATGKDRFSYKSNIFGMQIGGDLYHSIDGDYEHKAGIFASYSHNNLSFDDQYRTEFGRAVISDNKKAGSGKSTVVGVGGYYTFLTDSGSYIDAIAAYSHIRNEYEPNMMESYSQNGYGLSASLEGGYAYNIDQTNWTLMPQAQLIYHYLDLKNKQIAQGELKGVSGSTWLGRVGGQAIYNIDDTKKAYFGVDYWHRFNDNPSVAWGNSVFEENYGKNWFEVSVGGQYKISNRVNIFGDIRVC